MSCCVAVEEGAEVGCVVGIYALFVPAKMVTPLRCSQSSFCSRSSFGHNSCSRRHNAVPVVVVRGVRDALKTIPTMLNSCSDPIMAPRPVHARGYQIDPGVCECGPT